MGTVTVRKHHYGSTWRSLEGESSTRSNFAFASSVEPSKTLHSGRVIRSQWHGYRSFASSRGCSGLRWPLQACGKHRKAENNVVVLSTVPFVVISKTCGVPLLSSQFRYSLNIGCEVRLRLVARCPCERDYPKPYREQPCTHQE